MKWYIEEVLPTYGVEAESIESYRNGFLVKTEDDKTLFVKSVDASEKKMSTVYGAKKHMLDKGYSYMERYIPGPEGNICIEAPENTYVITEFIPGRDCDFDTDDIIIAAEALADFHNATYGFHCNEECNIKSDLFKLPDMYKKRINDISKMRKIAEKGREPFDKLFLEYAPGFEKLGKDALAIISESRYGELCEYSEKTGVLCHNDYTHYNIRIGKEGKAYILNMENVGKDLRIYDLVNLIRRKMRKCNWNFEECKRIVEAYDRKGQLTKDEMQIASAQLRFPQKFWRTANTYYNSRRGFVEKNNIRKLQEAIDEMKPLEAFLDSFGEQWCK